MKKPEEVVQLVAYTGKKHNLNKKDNPLNQLWEQTKSAGLIDGACKACSNKMGTLEAAKKQGLRLLDDMTGHPGMARYRDEGFEIVSF